MTVLTTWQTVGISDQTEMRVFMAKPSDKNMPMPSILVLQEAFGVNAHIRQVTQRIAEWGYIAAAPELYHRTTPGFESGYEDTAEAMQHLRAVTDDGLEADLRATYDLLHNDPQADQKHIGAVGFCMGGRAAFLANAILPLSCAVSYYGGGIADKLLPRVPDQHGPLLLFWGGQDAHVGPQQHYAVVDALRQAGKPFADVEFSEAGHGFFCDVRKSYHSAAATASWTLMTTFLAQNLKLTGI